VITGLKYAKGDIIVVSDADDTYPLEHVHKFLNIMKKRDIDYLITDRLTNSSRKAFPGPHLVGNKLLNLLFFCIFRCRFSDSQSGLLIFKKSLVNPYVLPFFGKHFAFNSELKFHLYKRAQKIAVIPIPYRRRMYGLTKQQWYKTGTKILASWLKTKFFLLLITKKIPDYPSIDLVRLPLIEDEIPRSFL
nr:glycosyltransferase [Candidatus Korarchaeota archaeon]NIU84386.1 glycosyltransferase [Candidatus Thorarchaeota archaeon]NIW14494.1 glycosyltransferase [Candidatus Thorarchaeota archaeon]NIW52574.1 glycosyltransferase [Candidatus Korarchaeota archaeon]